MSVVEQLDFGNAFTYQRCTIPLANQGFVYVRGKNGAGKSTPWEVLQHVNYGTTSKGLKKKGIICTVPTEDQDVEDGFWAEEVVRNDGGPYEGRWLIRQRQPSNGSLKVEVFKEIDGDWRKRWERQGHPTDGCPDHSVQAQKLASEILGLKQNEFEGCLYLSQKSSHTLIEGQPSERMNYLSYLFGIDKIDTLLKELKERLKKVDESMSDVRGLELRLEDIQRRLGAFPSHDTLKFNVSTLEQAHSFAKVNLQAWGQRRDAARDERKAADDREAVERELSKLGDLDLSLRQETMRELKQLTKRRDVVRDDLQAAKIFARTKARLDKALDDVGDADLEQDFDAKISKAQNRQAEIKSQLNIAQKRKKVEDELAPLNTELDIDDIREQIGFIEKAVEVKRAKYKERRARYDELEELIEKAEEGICPTCKKPLDLQNMQEMHAELENELHEIYDSLQKPKSNLKRLRSEEKEASKVSALKQKLEGLTDFNIEELEEETAKLGKRIRKYQSLRSSKQDIDSLRDQLKGLKSGDVEKLVEEVRDIESKIPTLKTLSDQFTRVSVLQDQLARIPEVDADDADYRVELTTDAYDDLMADADKVQASLTKAKEDLRLFDELSSESEEISDQLEGMSDILHRKKVLEYAISAMPKLKKRKLHKVVCAIRDVLPRYAGTMFSHEPNTKFVVEEDEESLELICRRVVSIHGRREYVYVPVKGFSGGEKQRLSVALLFTLHALLDPVKRPDILILDEVDKGLDDIGVASLMALVDEVRGDYGTVIMTSHRPEISGADFDRIWTVTKLNEVSTLRLAA